MPRRPLKHSQAEVTRLIKGALAAGIPMERITGIRIGDDGLTVVIGEPRAAEDIPYNEWDEVLPEELRPPGFKARKK